MKSNPVTELDNAAVLEAVSLVARTADGLTPHPVLPDGPVAIAAGEGTLG